MPNSPSIIPAGVQEFFGESLTLPAGNGTKTVFNRRSGFNAILMEAAVAARVALPPKIDAIWKHNTVTNVWTNLLSQGDAQPPHGVDGQVATHRGVTGMLPFTLLATDEVYIAFRQIPQDLYIGMNSAVNAVVSTLAVAVSTDTGFQTLTVTDNTKGTNTTMSTSGNITWTDPALWRARTISDQLGVNG